MITHKNITKIVTVMMAVAVIICILAMMFPEKVVEVFGQTGVSVQYESELFDTSQILQIDILMDQEDWEDMLAHAAEETYYSCDVMVNDEKIHNVGIRPKGNTSLSAIVMDPDTDRFSLKLEFDHYVDGQTCFGLDKLILNNQYADATNMKEALVYDMYQYLDADASLYNYAKISVNGEYWGVYLALEAVEDSFLLRNYGTADSALYKPEGMGMGGGRDRGKDDRENDKKDLLFEEMPKHPETEGRQGGNFSMGGNGANLNYTDDDLDSYSTIWDGEVTSTGKSDRRRVITALKHIGEGIDLERYLDIDNILRYMAVHVFSVNLDSLSGVMAHNYYLYEQNGQLNILPWDYNLSFGGMNMGRSNNATDMVNDAIDTPFQATTFFDALLEDETYRAKYHEYLEKLTEEYVCGGTFQDFYNRIRRQIDTLVQTDPTAFYSYEEYESGIKMLYQTVLLRAESINGQLDGSIPSTDEGQTEDASSLIDASSIDLEVMGVMEGQGPGRENRRFPGYEEAIPEVEGSSANLDGPAIETFQGKPPMSHIENEFPSGLEPPDMEQRQPQPPGAPDFGRGHGNNQWDTQTMLLNLTVYGVCLIAAILAFLLASRYRKKPY